MIRWTDAYNRLKADRQFAQWFGGGNRPPSMSSFRNLTFNTTFTGVAAVATPVTTYGTVATQNQQFPSGAVILGITACAYQEQTATGAFQYAPGGDKSRRDLFGIGMTYSNDEQITVGGVNGGLHLASSLLGTGEASDYPTKELVIPPSQSIIIRVASITVAPVLFISVCFHTMVPRAVS